MQLQISGQITGIEARNGGWMAVAILEPNNQYPKKLSTKKPDLIQQAQSLIGQTVTALYTESEGNSINPHTGTPYVNRYLEALTLGATAPTQQYANVQAPPQAVQAPQQYGGQAAVIQHVVPQDNVREDRIMRQSASKVAVELLQHLDEGSRNLASLVAISEQLVKYYREGVPYNVAPVSPVHTHAGPPPAEYAHDDSNPAGDDDIPF